MTRMIGANDSTGMRELHWKRAEMVDSVAARLRQLGELNYLPLAVKKVDGIRIWGVVTNALGVTVSTTRFVFGEKMDKYCITEVVRGGFADR